MNVGVKLVGNWKAAQKMLDTAPAAFDRALKRTIRSEAEEIAAAMRKRIASNIPPPNAPSTIHHKGSSKTLIASGEMRNSIQVVWKGKFDVFIGIPATANKGVAKLADIHENGKIVIQQMTEKQRRFLHANRPPGGGGGGGGGIGVIVIHIPARPFMRPTFEEYQAKKGANFIDAFMENLEGWLESGKK